MDHLHSAAVWIADHWVTIVTLWPLVTALITSVWRAIPQASRERFAHRYPRLDAAMRVVRKAGLDLLPMLVDIVRVFTGRRLPLPPSIPPMPPPPSIEMTESER